MNASRWAVPGVALCLACSGETPAGDKLPPQDFGPIVEPDASDASLDASDAFDAPVQPPFDGPLFLSETGLYLDLATKTVAPDIRAFDVRYPLWSDGTTKKRWLQLPPGGVIDTTLIDLWQFPVGTKAWKEFYVDGTLVETRFLHKRVDGWLKVAYLWSGEDAYAVPEGLANASGTSHDVPSVEQCEQCHNGAGDVLIGVSAFQLSKETGGGYLSKLIADSVLSNPPAAELTVPGDGVVEDALGYFHGNCGHCHNDQSFLAATHVLRLKLLSTAALPEDTPAFQSAIGTPTSHVLGGTSFAIVPGSPEQSQIFYRMSVRDLDQMPPTGTEILDPTGLATIASFIAGLPPP